MEQKINLVELLKDCPQGMELDCTMYDNCTFEGIEDVGYIDILVKTPSGRIRLTKEGCYVRHDDYAKCVIFPKGKTTWEGFVPPCTFKDGDILYTKTKGNVNWLSIYKELEGRNLRTYVDISLNNNLSFYYNSLYDNILCYIEEIFEQRLATEKEKEKLFQVIKENGYRWNEESKTLEKLIEPKFKVGDVIQDIDSYKVKITEVNIEDECYGYESMISKGIGGIGFNEQDNWKLVPNKFDITKLTPFKSAVLIRNDNKQKWIPAFWGYKTDDVYVTTFGTCVYCIPYEGNENLLNTNNDCPEYYKTWI